MRSLLRLPRWGDERGSIPMLMLVILVGVGIGAMLVPLIVTQNRTTRFDNSRVHALDAAQSGIDAVVGQIRSAVDDLDTTIGTNKKLPCGPIAGMVNTSGHAAYEVEIQYFAAGTVDNPAAPMICKEGFGTFEPTSGAATPGFATITSVGTDGPAVNGSSGGRTLETTYVFKTNNANIAGGNIRSYPDDDDTTNWCLDAGSPTPVPGTQILLQQCSTSVPIAPQQKFAYRSDLTLQLVSSVGSTISGTTYPNGLCIDIKNYTSTTPSTSSPLELQPCNAVESPPWHQMWSIDQHRSIQAARSNKTLADLCMTVARHSTSTPVLLSGSSGCTQVLTSPKDAWVPSTALGAGAAVKPERKQWINFQQFGRCMNVTANDPGAPFLTAPGCRQHPNANDSSYENQKFTYYSTTTKRVQINIDGTEYCLYSLHKESSQNLIDHRVLVIRCSSIAANGTVKPAQAEWKRTTPATDTTLPFSHQYRFQDSWGQCLSLADLDYWGSDDTWEQYDVWDKLVTATCNYSTLQQWNASANPGGSSLGNTHEN